MSTHKYPGASLVTRQPRTDASTREGTSASMRTTPSARLCAGSTNEMTRLCARGMFTSSLATLLTTLGAFMILGARNLARVPTEKSSSARMATMRDTRRVGVCLFVHTLTLSAFEFTFASTALEIGIAGFGAPENIYTLTALDEFFVLAIRKRLLDEFLTAEFGEIIRQITRIMGINHVLWRCFEEILPWYGSEMSTRKTDVDNGIHAYSTTFPA